MNKFPKIPKILTNNRMEHNTKHTTHSTTGEGSDSEDDGAALPGEEPTASGSDGSDDDDDHSDNDEDVRPTKSSINPKIKSKKQRLFVI